MPDAATLLLRDLVLSAFEGPGIDPPPLDTNDDGFGWLKQDADFRPDRIAKAAVLVPLVDRPHGMTVLLTRRTSHLRSHAGQVSFPGGKTENHDTSPEDTALRETEEEIGLGRDRIDLVGRLGRRTTGSGFQVTPIVGLVRPPFELVPDPGEVETIFEVPLEFVLDPANHRMETRLIKGIEREFHAMPYGEYYIWGLTARLLVSLSNTLVPR
ncbi:MAG: CoA pyrophosphatase [Rhodospirillaceae bacterium]